MKNAKKIISINKDPRAPIFKVSDIGIIGNINDVLPEIIEKL
jgi:electron transfer flavoprotein alpha subunit